MIHVFLLLRGKVTVVAAGRPGLQENPADTKHLGEEDGVPMDVGSKTVEHLENVRVELFRF